MRTLAGRDSVSPHVPILHTALEGHLAASHGDAARAIQAFESLLDTPRTTSELTWGIWEVLPYERLRLSELLLGQNRFHDALTVASVFDHPGAVTLLYFLPQSLAVRAKAAAALGWDQQVEEFRSRLAKLGRVSLLDAPGETFP
jgi:hypothetical protein